MKPNIRTSAIVFAIAAIFGVIAIAQRNGKQPARVTRATGPYDVSPLETEVLGQSRWLRGGPAAVRVIVTDHNSGKPVDARVKVALAAIDAGGTSSKDVTELYAGRTNGVGSIDAEFRAPSTNPGAYDLKVNVDSHLGKDEVTQRI